MGLDMYAYAVKDEDIISWKSDVNFKTKEDSEIKFAQWRKHADLHSWMENLYNEKGGKIEYPEDDFNCKRLILDIKDLEQLEIDIAQQLPKSGGGFFWGQSHYPEDFKLTLDFISEARQYIFQGYSVFYDSWW